MTMKWNIILPVLFITSLVAMPIRAQQGSQAERSPQTGQRNRTPGQTLDGLLVTALEHNPALRAARERHEAARLQAPQAAALPDLNIGAGIFAVPVETRLGPQRATLSFSQSFPWFGTLGAEENAVLARARQVEADYHDQRLRVFFDIRETWYRMYVLERSIESNNDQLAFLRTLLELARVRYEGGDTGYTDVLRLEMEVEEVLTRVRSLEDGRTVLRTKLSRATGMEVREDFAFPRSLDPFATLPAEEALRDRMLRNNPQLHRLEEERSYWHYRGVAARRSGYPKFTLGLTYIAIDPRTDMQVEGSGRDAIMPQVGISVPLFGSRYSSMEEQAVRQENAARESGTDRSNLLLVRLEETLRDHRDATRRIELNERLLAIAEQTRDIGLQEYAAGITSLEDLLGIERSLLRYALDKAEAEADLRISRDFIKYLTAEE